MWLGFRVNCWEPMREENTNKAKQFRSIRPVDNEMAVPSNQLPEESNCDRDTPADLAVTMRIDEAPTLESPAIVVDQLATRVGLRAIHLPSSWSSPLVDGISIYNQPTWLLPAIPRSSTVSGQASPSESQAPGGEIYFSLIRHLVKNSGIYAISSLPGRLVGLLIAPCLTHKLSQTHHGAFGG